VVDSRIEVTIGPLHARDDRPEGGRESDQRDKFDSASRLSASRLLVVAAEVACSSFNCGHPIASPISSGISTSPRTIVKAPKGV
jgi:hypothetical protein